jgi:hypothetical protein
MLEGLTKRFTAFYTFVDITTAESPNEDPKLHIVFWNMKEKKWLNCMEIEQVASQIDSAGKANIEVTLLTTIPIAFNHGVCVIYFPPRYVSIIILLIIKICNFHFFFFFEGKYFPSLKKKNQKITFSTKHCNTNVLYVLKKSKGKYFPTPYRTSFLISKLFLKRNLTQTL